MSNLIITIGREFGSGGHEVGVRLAKRLGIGFFDKELISLAAKKLGFSEGYLTDNEEKAPELIHGGALSGLMPSYYQQPMSDKIFNGQVSTMFEIARQTSCVIVGRCSDYILRDKGSINIFLHAPLSERVKRKQSLAGERVSDEKMEKNILAVDKQRARYYNYYADGKWGDGRNYHLCIDTSVTGIDGAVEVIITMLRSGNIIE